MAICGNCFNEIKEGFACETCGYDNAENLRSHPTALRVGAVLNGCFVIGRVLGQGVFPYGIRHARAGGVRDPVSYGSAT